MALVSQIGWEVFTVNAAFLKQDLSLLEALIEHWKSEINTFYMNVREMLEVVVNTPKLNFTFTLQIQNSV